MHRSGTSLIAALLRNAGVYLGEEQDFLPARDDENPDGFWEHFGFFALNDQMLQHLRAGWDSPELPPRWETRADLEPFRDRARLLVERLEAQSLGWPVWGWKDPRNSITIQFWRAFMPNLRVVVCVRDPREVAASLQRRNGLSRAAAERLWLRYYQNLLDHVPPQNRIATFYDAYFDSFESELARVLDFLGLPSGREVLASAKALVNPGHRHHRAPGSEPLAADFGSEVVGLHRRLREEAERSGPSADLLAETPVPAPPGLSQSPEADLIRAKFHAETAGREEFIRHLAQENARLRKTLSGLAATVGELTARERERRTEWSRLAEAARLAVHHQGLVASAAKRFAALHDEVELPLGARLPWLPRRLGESRLLNYLYRSCKRLPRVGAWLVCQREFDTAVSEGFGSVVQVLDAAVRLGAQSEFTPPGLEGAPSRPVPVDLTRLMELLQLRLS
jgi:hypothetical protein